MNLWLRVLWLLLSFRFKAPMALSDAVERAMRVMPGDLVINGHVNNGRYLTLVDLAILDLFLRSGTLGRALREGWRSMSGGSMISYRRGLTPFARCAPRFQLLS
jgi:acyl-CoA thioesterase FadM